MTRRIVCAAVRINGVIVPSARHYDPVMRTLLELVPRVGPVEQGFIDQYGTFLTRREAHVVAKAAGQILRRVGGDSETLYSENLY